ncbi:MAG: hypothetical protein R3C03_15970 [Pirellulaceae bacterium]
MLERDIFVAFVAFVLGFGLIIVSVTNNGSYFQMRSPAMLSNFIGRSNARLVVAAAGGLAVFMGVYVSIQHLPLKRNAPSLDSEFNIDDNQ